MSTIELIASKTAKSLLGDYVFCGIESEGEQNVVEKYTRSGVEYLLSIPKQDNVKHGQAEMRDKSGRLIASLTFTNGIFSGPCILRNPMGIIQFKGSLENGKKSGHCVEYDERGRKLLEGIYRENQTIVYTEIKEGIFCGYYEEKIMNGMRVSISQIKRDNLRKHGRSLEFSLDKESDIPVSEKYYEDGRMVYEHVRVNGNRMSEFDEGGNLMYEGEFEYMDGEFLRWGKGVEYEGEKIMQYEGEFANNYYHGKGVLYRNGCAYYNGEWKCGYPNGDGSLYDDDGQVKMECMWNLGDVNGVDYESGGKRGMCSSCWSDPRGRLVEERMVRIKKKEEEEGGA